MANGDDATDWDDDLGEPGAEWADEMPALWPVSPDARPDPGDVVPVDALSAPHEAPTVFATGRPHKTRSLRLPKGIGAVVGTAGIAATGIAIVAALASGLLPLPDRSHPNGRSGDAVTVLEPKPRPRPMPSRHPRGRTQPEPALRPPYPLPEPPTRTTSPAARGASADRAREQVASTGEPVRPVSRGPLVPPGAREFEPGPWTS